VFGLIVTLCFLLLVGSLVTVYWSHNEDLTIAKVMMLVLYFIAVVEFVLSAIEFPLYVVDGIVYISMGNTAIAHIMIMVYALFFIFLFCVTLPHIKWGKFLTPTPAKLIVTGLLIILCLVYTELFNGLYSFKNPDDYFQVRDMYSQYDNHFFPTKFIEKDGEDGKHVSVYPFDASSAAGELDFAYRAEISVGKDDKGITRLYFYPFTYKVFDGLDKIDFEDPTYIPQSKRPKVSGSDKNAVSSATDAVSDAADGDGGAQ
jgi:hypothetical protein